MRFRTMGDFGRVVREKWRGIGHRRRPHLSPTWKRPTMAAVGLWRCREQSRGKNCHLLLLYCTDGNTVTLSFFSASSFHLSSVFVRYSPRGGQHPSAITTTPRPASIIRFFSRGPPERRQMNSSSKSVNSCYPRQSRRETAEILQALVLCVPPS